MDARFAIGGIMIETNSFVDKPADLAWFKSIGYLEGKELLSNLSNTNSVPGGIISAAEAFGWELVPSLVTTPLGGGGGVVTKDTMELLLNRILAGLSQAGHLDGMFVLLHGAMIADGHPDGEGYVLKTIRDAVGPDFPLSTTFDFQGAVSQQIVDNCDIVTGYDTYPHTDWYDRGFESAKFMREIVRGEKKFSKVLKKPRILPNLPGEYTGRHPMATMMSKVREIEAEDGISYVMINPGFPYCDVAHAGFSVVVATDNDEKLAEEKATELEDMAWDSRDGFARRCLPVEEALDEALRPEYEYRSGPVVLADEGDAVFGGSPGNGVSILRGLLDRRIDGGAVFLLEPSAVEKAIASGVGTSVKLTLGGTIDEPLDVEGTVKLITDGVFDPIVLRNRVDKHTFEMGKTATLRSNGNDIVLISKPAQFNFLEEWRSVGVEPLRKRILVIKSPVHYREHFEPVASKIIEVDTPGLTPANLKRLSYKNVRRPIVPLDEA